MSEIFKRYISSSVVCAILIGGGFYIAHSTIGTIVVENVMYAIDPSAERAFTYGERHFNARDTNEYDLDRAEYFFGEALRRNAPEPYLYHELAHIAFLRGKFSAAIAYINIQIDTEGDQTPNSYYMRGLIEGYQGDYTDAVEDYATYLTYNPDDWAAINDYAWVLLKAGRPLDAQSATVRGLSIFPNNPWLLNTDATALYEMGLMTDACEQIVRAVEAVKSITKDQWLTSYPGNDPQIAEEGIATFKKAVETNMHTIFSSATTTMSK